jgi:hypothetical protein
MSRAVSAADFKDTAVPQTTSLDRYLVWTVFVILLITVAIYLAVPFLAIGWFQRPFIGAFVEKPFIFNGVGDPADPAWSARQVVPEGHRLTAVDGQPVADADALGRLLLQRQVGQTVTLSTLAVDGGAHEYVVTLSAFPLTDLARYFVVPYLIGWMYLAIGAWVFRLRRHEPAGRAFALTCALTAVAVGALFDLYTTHAFTWAWTLAIPNIGAATFSLALVFPQTVGLCAASRWRGWPASSSAWGWPPTRSTHSTRRAWTRAPTCWPGGMVITAWASACCP